MSFSLKSSILRICNCLTLPNEILGVVYWIRFDFFFFFFFF